MTTTYGTLGGVIGFPVDVELVRDFRSTDPATGFVAARNVRENVSRQSGQPQARVWRVVFGPDGFSSLLAAFDAAKGDALPLEWTPPAPDNTALPVRFQEGTLRVQKRSGGQFRAEVMLEEVA